MDGRKRVILIASTLLIIAAFGVSFFQGKVDKIRSPKSLMEEKLIYIPSADFTKTASLGFHAALADFLWARTVVYFGEHVKTDGDYKWLYHLLDVVTTLDPENILAFRFGGNLLALEMNDIESSIKLLEKGIDCFAKKACNDTKGSRHYEWSEVISWQRYEIASQKKLAMTVKDNVITNGVK